MERTFIKEAIVVLGLLLGTLPAMATESVDSLLKQAESIAQFDSRLAFLDSLCKVWTGEARPGGVPLFEQRLAEYAKQDNDLELMRKVAGYARYHIYSGNLDLAKAIWLRYADWANTTNDTFQKRTYYYEFSFVEERMENNAAALVHINEAIKHSEALADSTYIIFGEAYKAKGRILQAMGRFAEAVVELNKAKSVFVAAKDSIGIEQTMMQLGIVHGMIGLYDESEKFIEDRYKYIPNAPESSKILDAINLGRNELSQNKNEAAFTRYGDIYNRGIIPNVQIWVYPYIANGYIESLYFTERYNEIPAVYTTMVDSFGFLRAEEGIGFLFDQSQFFNDLINEDFASAEALGLKLYNGSVEKGDATEAMLHTRFLMEVYKKSERPREALKYSEMLSKATDSTRTANKMNALLLYQTQYETKEKENEIAQLNNEKEIQEARSRFYLAIAGGLLGLILIGGILYSKLRKLKNVLAEQKGELEVLNATKNKFFRIIGHDLRNPIITFKALRNRIERQRTSEDQEGVSASLELIGKSTDQVTGLLDNLMEWVLGQDGIMPYEPETIALSEVVHANVELYRELAAEKQISLEQDIAPSMQVWADRNALNGVCRNLISNAVKFTAQGGKVQVSAADLKEGIELSFADNGVGIHEDQIQTIFNVGTKTGRGTAGESGSGLGLALVKELVELNKGSVRVASEQNKGTTFTVKLLNN